MRGQGRGWIAERLFWLAGTLGLLFCLLSSCRIVLARRTANRIGAEVPVNSAAVGAFRAVVTGPEAQGTGLPAVVGRVEIPSLGLSTPLLAGDDSMSLTEGAGHIPGTAYPGGLGTVGIAGHRDTHFRMLRKASVGMDVRLIDHTGTYHYRVTSTEVVTPEQVSVLDIVSEPGLALITCFPFGYVGRAPRRFVVHAVLVSAAPDEPAG